MTRSTNGVRATVIFSGPPGSPTIKPAASEQRTQLAPVFILTFLALIFPFFFEISSLYLSTSRVILLVYTPILLVKMLSGSYGGVRYPDIGVLLYVFWLALSILVNNTDVFVTCVGSNAIIILGGYLFGRAFIRNGQTFTAFILLYGAVLLFSLPFALVEARTSVMALSRLIDKLPLISSSIDVNYPPRRGLYRVQFTFTHPIHYGLFASMCFSLVLVGLKGVTSTVWRLGWGAAIAICAFLSVSSGPLIGVAIQVLLVGYAWKTQHLKARWTILLSTVATIYIILEILSDRPAFYAISERLAFEQNTAYVRKILLDYGLAQIGRTPFLGIGYNKWDLPNYMSGSLDNFWLLAALVYGIPAAVFLVSTVLYLMVKIGLNDIRDPRVVHLRLSWNFTMAGLLFSLSTVAVWSEMMSLLFLFIGAGVWLAEPQKSYVEVDQRELVPHRPASVYTRFPQRSRPANPNSTANAIRESTGDGNGRN